MNENKYRMKRWVEDHRRKDKHKTNTLLFMSGLNDRSDSIKGLRESEEKFQLITENMNDTIWLLDLNLQAKYISPSITRYSGYSLEDAKKLSLLEILTPDTKDRLHQILEKELIQERLEDADSQISTVMEASYYKKDGTIDWAEVTATLIRDHSGHPEGFLCVVRSISDRKNIENALKQSESRWHFALEGSGEAVWDWNILTNKVFYSRRFEELFGSVSPDDWKTYEAWLSRVHPDDIDIVNTKLHRYLEGSDPVYSIEYRFRSSDHSYRWVFDRGMITERAPDGSPSRMVGTFNDITNNRRMEQILIEDEEKFRLLAERSTDIISLHEINGSFKYVSPVCLILLGFEPGEMTGHSIMEFIHPEDKTLVKYVLDHLDEINEVQPLDYRIKTKDGKYLWMETTALVIRHTDSGLPLEIQMTSRNVTERVKAEEALRESEIKLRSVITQSQDGITLINEEGKIIEWSKGQEKITGIPSHQANGEYIWDIQTKLMPDLARSPKDLENFKKHTLDMLADGNLTFGNTIQESTLYDVNGKTHKIQTLAFPVRTAHGYMIGSVIRDVTEIQQAEEALYRSEERLRFITDNMLDMISYINADLLLEYVSPSASSITGYREDELIGLPIIPFIHPEDLAYVKNEIRWSIKNKTQNNQVECRFRQKDGNYICIESTVNLLLDSEGKFAGAIFGSRDISEKKKAVDALRDSESRYRTLARNFPNGAVMLFDMDLRYKVADGSGLSHINLSREQLEGHTIFEIYTPETIATLEPYYKAVLKGRTEVFEVPIGEVTYEVYAVPIRNEKDEITFGMVMTQDVTEKKLAVETLKTRAQYLMILNEITRIALEESDLKVMMQQIVDLLAAMFMADHCYITSWNPVTRKPIPMAAYGPLRENYALIQFGNDEQTLTESVIEAGTPIIIPDLLNSQAISPELAKKMSSKSMLVLPLIGGGENLGAILIGYKDDHSYTVDEMKRAEQVAGQIALSMYKVKLLEEVRNNNVLLENRVAERTADLESKNHELETFTYSVSHDLKAPLRGIDGYSRLILEDHSSQLDAEGLEFLHTIRQATKQMNQLIEDLLSYSRLERRALSKESIDIQGLVKSLLLERSEDIHSNHIDIIEEIPPVSISVDGKALEQALRNLIDNAIKFSSGNAHPVIKVSGSLDSGNSTILCVEDNGIGFDMKYSDRIFDIFQRLHLPEEYPGTGIGLAIVRKAMIRLGGKVWAESQPDAGAKFYLDIPG